MQRIARLSAAVLILAGGAVHLQLWRGGYRGIPRIGPWFMANVIISAVLALALLLRNDARVAVAGVIFSVASLSALVMSRTIGIFGFTEKTWTSSVVQATGAEVGAVEILLQHVGSGTGNHHDRVPRGPSKGPHVNGCRIFRVGRRVRERGDGTSRSGGSSR